MKNNINILVLGILAGIMIALGGTIYLSLDNKVLGSLFFGIGLFMIVTNNLYLYTGKVGYIINNKIRYVLEVLITLFGNFIGTFLIGFILKFTRIYSDIHIKANMIWNIKLNDTLISIFILSILCGILMYLAVNGYKEGKDGITKILSVFLSVMVFILCGFEHSIANMYYLSVASIFNFKVFLYLFVMILGNAIGTIIIPLSRSITDKSK